MDIPEVRVGYDSGYVTVNHPSFIYTQYAIWFQQGIQSVKHRGTGIDKISKNKTTEKLMFYQ